MRGHYLPIWAQVNKIKKQNPYKIVEINGKKFAQLIGCLDTGSDTGLLDDNVAAIFDFKCTGEKQLRLNTVTSSQIKTFQEDEVQCLGTNGVIYNLGALEIKRIGQDTSNPPEFVSEICELM